MTLLSLEERLKQEIKEELLKATEDSFITKEDIKETLLKRRQDRLLEHYHDLSKVEAVFMEVVNKEVDWENIKPVLKWVETAQERKIWEYVRNVISSMPYNFIVGRQMYYYFEDANTGRWLGIVCLASALNAITPRHEHLGWDNPTKFNNLGKVMNIAVCVPIQPFGMLCGGKLLFVSALCNEVIERYREEYEEELLAIETTSLYGKSSQYNRVPEFKYLGLTKGSGNVHISDELWLKIRQYFELRPEFNKVGKHSQKLRSVDHIARAVGLSGNLSTHKHQRGYYWGVTAENSEAILKGLDSSEPSYYDRPLQSLIDSWHERWYKMRLDKKKEEAVSFNSSVYLLDNNIPTDKRQTRQISMF